MKLHSFPHTAAPPPPVPHLIAIGESHVVPLQRVHHPGSLEAFVRQVRGVAGPQGQAALLHQRPPSLRSAGQPANQSAAMGDMGAGRSRGWGGAARGQSRPAIRPEAPAAYTTSPGAPCPWASPRRGSVQRSAGTRRASQIRAKGARPAAGRKHILARRVAAHQHLGAAGGGEEDVVDLAGHQRQEDAVLCQQRKLAGGLNRARGVDDLKV